MCKEKSGEGMDAKAAAKGVGSELWHDFIIRF